MRRGLISYYMMKIILIILAVFIAVCLVSWIADTHRFVTRYYEIKDRRIKKNIRLVLISDLHNKEYGTHNQKLLDEIHRINPDGVLIAGDLTNGLKGSDFTPALELLDNLRGKYPLYYGMGNHEYRLKLYPDRYGDMWERYSAALEDMGIHILENESVFLEEYNIDIASVSIDRAFYKRAGGRQRLKTEDMRGYMGEADKKAFQLLIAHNPEYFDAYNEWGADLTVSGHVHGGVMRLPFIGGIISPRLVEFPNYSGGKYTKPDGTMIVSCGLGTHTINVRVFNPAELAVIDIVNG